MFLVTKVAAEMQEQWQETYSIYTYEESNDNGRRLLQFAKFNNLLITNTSHSCKPSRFWAWHSPNKLDNN